MEINHISECKIIHVYPAAEKHAAGFIADYKELNLVALFGVDKKPLFPYILL